MVKKISFINGEESEVRDFTKTSERISEYNKNVSFELCYLKISQLNLSDGLNNFDTSYKDESQQKLIDSIVKYGMILPILVYPDSNNEIGKKTYTVIDGEERVKALSQLGKDKIFALIDYTVTPQTSEVLKLILKQKVDLNINEKYSMFNHIRNITEDLREKDIENMLNEKNGAFNLYSQLLDLEERYKNVPKLYKQLIKLKEQLLNGKIDLEDCYNKANKKVDNYHKKKEKEEAKEELDKMTGKSEDALGDIDDVDKGEDAVEQEKGYEENFTEIGNQNYQQTVNNRRILPSSLVKQLMTRDESMCTICGFGGKHNLSVVSGLEKHHIVDVQYGGSDNLNNLITLCPNCHSLVTNFLTGRANEYNPTEEDLKNNPQNWGSVVLGNMGRIAKEAALKEIKKKDLNVYNKVKAHKMTVGQAVEKLKIENTMPDEFNNNPYETFKHILFSLVDKQNFKLYNQTLKDEYEGYLNCPHENSNNDDFIQIDKDKEKTDLDSNNISEKLDKKLEEKIQQEKTKDELSDKEDDFLVNSNDFIKEINENDVDKNNKKDESNEKDKNNKTVIVEINK